MIQEVATIGQVSWRALMALVFLCVPAATLSLVGASPALATTDCTVTQGAVASSTVFTNQAGLQTFLDAPPCSGTLNVDFTTGLTLGGTALSWTQNQPLNLLGQAATSAVLNGGGVSGVLNSTSSQPVGITGLTVTGGRSCGDGGGINAVGDVTVAQSIVSNNTAQDTGPTPNNGGGGGVNAGGAVTITGSTISGNTAVGSGGNNRGNGGGVNAQGNVTVTGSTISGNTAAGPSAGGGGISGNSVTLTASRILNNATTGDSDIGGGVVGVTVTVTSSTISGNSVSGNNSSGGGLSTSGGDATITGSTISGNTANGLGGGVIGLNGNVSITGSTISGNTAAESGGGVESTQTTTLTNSTVSGNSATGGSAGGGGLDGSGSVTLVGSTISGNTTTGRGGGIRVIGPRNISVTNSTISANAANSPSRAGGGISASGATWLFKFATVSSNTAPTGANVYDQAGAASFTSIGSVIANASGSSCAVNAVPTAASLYNATLAGDMSCGFAGVTNLSATWARLNLGALAVNGNPTGAPTLMPGSASVLIGQVPSSYGQSVIGPSATDERGVIRFANFWVGAAQLGAQAQTLVHCGLAPRVPGGVKRGGLTRLTTAGCRTNTGQAVRVSATANLRGDMRLFKIIKYRNGRVQIRTFGHPLRLRITWSAPGLGNYAAYRVTRRYQT